MALKEKKLLKESGWALVFKCVAFGVLPILLSLAVLDMNFDDLGEMDWGDSQSWRLLGLAFSFALVESAVVSNKLTSGLLGRAKPYIQRWVRPAPLQGTLYEYFQFLSSESDDMESVVLLTCKNRKVYVGFLESVDLNVNISFNEMFVAISPLKSGFRSIDTLEIVFSTDYVGEFHRKIKEYKLENDDGEKVKKYEENLCNEFASNVIYIPISEIFSITSFIPVLF